MSYQDETVWTEITSNGPYQERFSTDGRWQWRPRVSPEATEPEEWRPGRPPKDDGSRK